MDEDVERRWEAVCTRLSDAGFVLEDFLQYSHREPAAAAAAASERQSFVVPLRTLSTSPSASSRRPDRLERALPDVFPHLRLQGSITEISGAHETGKTLIGMSTLVELLCDAPGEALIIDTQARFDIRRLSRMASARDETILDRVIVEHCFDMDSLLGKLAAYRASAVILIDAVTPIIGPLVFQSQTLGSNYHDPWSKTDLSGHWKMAQLINLLNTLAKENNATILIVNNTVSATHANLNLHHTKPALGQTWATWIDQTVLLDHLEDRRIATIHRSRYGNIGKSNTYSIVTSHASFATSKRV